MKRQYFAFAAVAEFSISVLLCSLLTAPAHAASTIPDCTGFVPYVSSGAPPSEHIRKRRDQMVPNYILGCMTILNSDASCGRVSTPHFRVLVAYHANLGPNPRCVWSCQLNTGSQTMCRQTIDAGCGLPVELLNFKVQ